MERPRQYENAAYVLDGQVQNPVFKPRQRFQGSVAHVVGENYFTLLEVLLDARAKVQPLSRVIVAKAGRREINFVFGRISFAELSGVAKTELQPAIQKIVWVREKYFVNFFNTAPPISSRMHSLEVLPGFGKKHRTTILNMRDRKPFESFDDFRLRTGIADPIGIITKRILDELAKKQPHILFTRRD